MATSRDEGDEFDEEFEDDNPREGQQVYEAWFDSDGIGSGGNYVYLFRGKYYFVTDEVQGFAVDALEDAIFVGAGGINSCCSRITCRSIKSEELVRMLTVHDDCASVEINGERWDYDKKTGWNGPPRKPQRQDKQRRGTRSRPAPRSRVSRHNSSTGGATPPASTGQPRSSSCVQLDPAGLLRPDFLCRHIPDDLPCSR